MSCLVLLGSVFASQAQLLLNITIIVYSLVWAFLLLKKCALKKRKICFPTYLLEPLSGFLLVFLFEEIRANTSLKQPEDCLRWKAR